MGEKGIFIIISGPSGAGKGTIFNSLLEKMPSLRRAVSVTTRKPRVGEVEGVHYYFRSEAEFAKMVKAGEFLETAEVFGKHHYGTLFSEVERIISSGADLVLEIDVQGAKQVKKKVKDCTSIFIMPPDFATLESRLRDRGTEDEGTIERRLKEARCELRQYSSFDYIIFNDELERAVVQAVNIINAQKNKISHNEHRIVSLLENDK